MIVSMTDILPLQQFIKLVYDTTDDIKLVFGFDGLKINLLNNSHVCFYNAFFRKDYFDTYDLGDESIIELILDSKDLFLIMNLTKNGSLTIESEDALKCKFTFEADTRRVFELSTVDGSYDSPVPPSIDFDLDFKMGWSDLKQCCTDLDKIIGTDRFVLSFSEEGFIVKSPEDAMSNYENKISYDSFKSIQTIVNVDYLSCLSKLERLGDLELHIGDNIPLGWSVESFDVKYNGLIAPIIEED